MDHSRGVAQPGRAPRSGRGGQRSESSHPDQQFFIHHSKVEISMQRPLSIGLKNITTTLLAFALVTLMFFTHLNVIAADNIGSRNTVCDLAVADQIITSPVISVLTLNLAHGRKDAVN